MRAFGKYSYAAYVWHRMVSAGVHACERKTHTSLPWFVEIPLMISATLAVSMASYALIERPFLALKRYFKPRDVLTTPANAVALKADAKSRPIGI
jgi:peptidoglycan/LPS O-acetylase OafA/YrhL